MHILLPNQRGQIYPPGLMAEPAVTAVRTVLHFRDFPLVVGTVETAALPTTLVSLVETVLMDSVSPRRFLFLGLVIKGGVGERWNGCRWHLTLQRIGRRAPTPGFYFLTRLHGNLSKNTNMVSF
jgi:hypothetical protein